MLRRILKSDSKKSQVLRFVITGGIATLLQYGFYLLLVNLTPLSPAVGTIVSYCISLAFNFFLSNYFTFRTKPNSKKAASFLTSHLVNMGLQTLLVVIFNPIVGKDLALIPAMLICIPINFLLVRFSLTSKYFQK